MNKGVKLLLAVLCLGVLIGAYFGVRSISDDGETPAETTTYLFVVETDPANLVGIKYELNGKAYTFAYNGSKWINPADEHMPLDQTAIATSASALTTVACNRFISQTGNTSAEYGLDDPTCTVTLTYSDGSTVAYSIGAKNKHTSEYYFTKAGSTAVYGVNGAILDYCSKTYDDLLALDKIESIDTAKVEKIVTAGPFGSLTLEKLTRTETEVDSEGVSQEKKVTYYVLTNEAGEKNELDAETGDEIVDGVLAPIVLSCPDYYAEDGELAKYGLDAPVTLTVHYYEELQISTENSSAGTIKNQVQYVISFGFVKNAEGKDTVYMQLPDSDMVFEVDASAFASLF